MSNCLKLWGFNIAVSLGQGCLFLLMPLAQTRLPDGGQTWLAVQ